MTDYINADTTEGKESAGTAVLSGSRDNDVVIGGKISFLLGGS
jgi:hypothetical protein